MTGIRSAATNVPVRRCRVFVDGYLANREALCRDAHLPPTTGDAELIADAYRRFGSGFPARVFGEYAVALFDEDQKALLLTHDALGVFGLFYAERPGELLFSSHLEDLIALIGIGELDEDTIAETLVGIADHRERTPYRHIHRLRQCRSVLVRDGELRSIPTYDPSAVRPLRLLNSTDYEEHFRNLVVEAVSSALPAVGKVWCELSGGLDSSTIVSLAASALRTKFETFSVVFSQSQEADETEWIDAVLNAYPVPSHRLDGDGAPPFSSVPDRFQAEPTGRSLIVGFDQARTALFEAHGVKIVLTGMCGDAVFIGDAPEPYYLADITNPGRLLEELRRWARESGDGRSLGHWFRRYFLQPHLGRGKSARPPPPWISGSYVERWRDTAGAGEPDQRLNGLSFGDAYYWNRVLKGALLVRDGQNPMSGGCDFRNPWLYLPFVEFMAATPWAEKLRAGSDRTLQRRALKGTLPERVRLRDGKRVPSQAFFGGLRRSDSWARLLTDRPNIVERGYVDGDRWREAVTLAQNGYCNSPSGFIQACVLESWFATLERAPLRDAEVA